MMVLDGARIGIQASTAVEPRAAGLSSSDSDDSLTFRSSDIEFWGIGTVDDIDNIHSASAVEEGRVVPATRLSD